MSLPTDRGADDLSENGIQKTTVTIMDIIKPDETVQKRNVSRNISSYGSISPHQSRTPHLPTVSSSQPGTSNETRAIRPAYAEDVYGVTEDVRQPGKVRRRDLDINETSRPTFMQKNVELESEANPTFKINVGKREGDLTDSSSTEMSGSALAQRRSAHLPKLKEFPAEPAFESTEPQSRTITNDLDFEYTDCDTHSNELAELYTYSEIEDFALNIQCYRDYINSKKLGEKWSSLPTTVQDDIFFDLAELLDNGSKKTRLNAARCFLYLMQGAFLDFSNKEDGTAVSKDSAEAEVIWKKGLSRSGSEKKCLSLGITNAYHAYRVGVFHALCNVLAVEINEPFDAVNGLEQSMSVSSSVSNSRSASNADLSESAFIAEKRSRKSATLKDNEMLRIILSALYHMIESIRREDVLEVVVATDEKEAYMKLRNDFITELREPCCSFGSPLVMVLFDMMPAFYRGTSPHFPMRKVLLLIWKILLAILGGWKELREMKASRRAAAGLNEIEDTVLVGDCLKACNVNGNELEQNPRGSYRTKRNAHPSARLLGRQLACVAADDFPKELEDDISTESGEDILSDTPSSSNESFDEGFKETIDNEHSNEESKNDETLRAIQQDGVSSPVVTEAKKNDTSGSVTDASINSGDKTPVAGSPPPLLHEGDFRKIPFRSKVREEDIETFLQHMRMKFFNYRLPGDSTTVFGLPEATCLSVQVMRRNLYVSLGDLQVQKEKLLNRYLFSQRETDIELTSAEQLYRLMLPNLSQYVIALLKVLLAAAPSSKPKNELINILSDVLTVETEGSEVLSSSMNSSSNNILEQSVRVAIDVNRHKEIMVKAASSILILLIKHFRSNHIYQFEYLCQHLVFANCIPLILKFLDQNIVRYIQSKQELEPFNYPAAPLYYVQNREEWPPLTDSNVESSDSHVQDYYLWRNVFSTINLLRVLNKLTKWKHARTMMLVVYKSAPMLKRALRIRLGIFQLYVLKLLKMQARYLGRQWRRSNMELMSSIFSRVRHRINDDWAFANETRSKSWDFHNEESALKAAVERFNSRRYAHLYPALALEPNESPSPGEKYLDTINLHEFEPVDNSFQSVLGTHREMSERFKKNYKKWLDDEVFRHQINWDQLLCDSRGIIDLL